MEQKSTNSPGALINTTNLTRSQFLIWTGQKLNPGAPLYNMALAYTIHGEIDIKTFTEAFQKVVDESDAMRTIIEEIEGVPIQKVLSGLPYKTTLIDYREKNDPVLACETFTSHRCQNNFQIDKCLFESILIRLGDDKYVWYMNQHHLATDGWSAANLFKRVSAHYQNICANQSAKLEKLPAYKNYRTFEAEYRKSEAFKKSLHHWHKKAGTPVDDPLFYGKPLEKIVTRTERVYCNLGAERSQKLKEIANEKGVRSLTPDITLLNIFSTFLFTWLYRASKNKNLSIGTFAHNRSTEELKSSLGLFIELFPLYAQIDEDETFLSLIEKTGREAFSFLTNAQPATGNANLEHPYGAILNFINASFSDFSHLPVTSRWIHPGHGDRGHSLRLQVHDFDNSGRFQLHFDFNTETFNEEMRRFAVDHFLRIIDSFIENRNQKLQDIDLIGKENRRYILEGFNSGKDPNPLRKTALDFFDRGVTGNGDSTAIKYRDQRISYKQLDSQANQLAKKLQGLGLGPKNIAAICCTRSPEMIISILAVLKCGAAYVPIDPAYPKERVKLMLDDTSAKVVLAQKSLKKLLPQNCTALFIDEPNVAIANNPQNFRVNIPAEDDPAYIIYTSGSTGKPKGVVIPHKALANYLSWAKAHYLGKGIKSLPLFSSFSADLTVTSIFLPLVSGGTIVIYEEENDGADLSILKVIEDDAVDMVKLTPSHLALIENKKTSNTRLKKIIVGGEDFKTALARKVLAIFPQGLQIYNEYGPTEATVGCMIHTFNEETDIALSVPIGKPVANMQIFVLDKQLRPVPFGFEGEIYISGKALALGYLNQPKLTDERFIDNPFLSGQKMYRTGDLARWTATGDLEFSGRIDSQVKVRGFRIELGEVESTLAKYPKVKQCAVSVTRQQASKEEDLQFCRVCGLASNHPDAKIDDEGICSVCHQYEKQRKKAHNYFKSKEQLHQIFEDAKATKQGKYDCLMLLSGGKDSTYVLYQLVEMGLTPLVFSMDNGYISDQAKVNIQRVVDALGLDLVWGTTPAMNEIFVDSLKRFSNVCNGCYKVIYTLSVNLAREKGIRYIITGLSRGQFFETRVAQLYKSQIFDAAEIDHNILEARKAYHRMDDAVSRCMDVSVFKNDTIFDEVQFIDYYRYTDVQLSEMLDFLDKCAGWIRPTDTGRSTNCLINEAGIYVHKKERGFHNYALPYSWDVRLGHKQRDAALEELDDDIDEANVQRILNEIGYTTAGQRVEENKLTAWYVAHDDIPASSLREFIGQKLPTYMLPSHFIRLEKMPLNPTGKIDYKSLPLPGSEGIKRERQYVSPQTEVEKILAEIWQAVMGIDKIGIHDDFFDLGGDSILNIQIIARASQRGLKLTSGQLFDYPTIFETAKMVSFKNAKKTTEKPATGTAKLTPIQYWFFDQEFQDRQHWNMSLKIELARPLDPKIFEVALKYVVRQHAIFRIRFEKNPNGWRQYFSDQAKNLCSFIFIELASQPQTKEMEPEIDRLQKSLNLKEGPLFKSILFDRASGSQILFLTCHHLIIDGVSWQILLEDLENSYTQLESGKKTVPLVKTASFKNWSEQMHKFAQSKNIETERAFWQNHHNIPGVLPIDYNDPMENNEASAQTVSTVLLKRESDDLLQKALKPYRLQINEFLLAALAPVLTQWLGSDSFCMNMEGHGREEIGEDIDISRTIGWFTSIFPVRLNIKKNAPQAEIIQSVKEQYRKIPSNGVGYGVIKYLASPKLTIDEKYRPQILFNYLGQTDHIINKSHIFSSNYNVLGSHAPTAKRAHLLEINAFIIRGQLEVHWTFSKNWHKESTIRNLAENYRISIEKLIDHCLSPEAGSVTATDFPLAKLSGDKLSKLSKLLGD